MDVQTLGGFSTQRSEGETITDYQGEETLAEFILMEFLRVLP